MKTFKTSKGTELPLLNMRGKDYLQVAHRLVWFREEKPDWSITTDFITYDASSAWAKAIITNAEGRIIATAHKYENTEGFADYREKAETGAIGRALALIGYGTQFCDDELDEGERIVDSPMPNKHAVETNSPALKCGVCDSSLKLSKAGTAYYCPNFKDNARGEHTRMPV